MKTHPVTSTPTVAVTLFAGGRRRFRPRLATLTMTAGLFIAPLPSLLHGAGNPVPISGTFYVSPSGNDTSSGDISAPLATLGKAKELAVAWIHQTDGSGTPINHQADIYLRTGSYPLVAPATNPVAPGLEFTPADTRAGATITFRNSPGETAVVHGALEFVAANTAESGSWQQVPLTVYDGGTATNATPKPMKAVNVQKYVFSGAMRAELQERITNLRAAGINGGHACFTELYINDTRKTRARHPNARAIVADTSKFTVAPANADQRLSLAQPVVRVDSKWVEMVQGAPLDDFSPVLDGHTEIVFTRGWQWARGIITSGTYEVVGGQPRIAARIGAMENPPLDPNDPSPGIHDHTYDEGQLADLACVNSLGVAGPETWNKARFENNKLFVDQPGEWFFDDDEIALYYLPAATEVVTTAKFQIPVTYRLVALNGTETDNGDGTYTENFVQGVRFIGEGTGNFNTTSNYRLQFQKSAWKYENNRGNSEFYSARHTGYVQSGAIDGIHVEGLTVAYCKFSQFGATAISLGGNRLWATGVEDRAVYDHQPRGSILNANLDNNFITDGGGNGIRVDHYPRKNALGRYPADNNNITSNFITLIGKNFADGVGILVPHGIKTWVYQNSINDVPFLGIKAGYHCFRDNGTPNAPENERVQVRANGVVRAMRKLIDGGGIYTGGGRHMIIANNTMVSIGATRDVDAVVASSNARLIVDIYLDLSSQSFTVSANAASELLVSRTGHVFTNQGGTIYPTEEPNTQTCPDVNTGDGCCGE